MSEEGEVAGAPRRVSLGVDPLDLLLDGVQPGSILTMLGPPGSGASTLAVEFMLKDVERGERAAVLLTTRRTWELLRIAEAYGQELKKGLDGRLIKVVEIENPFAQSEVNEALVEFFTALEEFKPSRVYVDVIDPLLVTLGRRGLMSGLIGPLIELSRRKKLLTLIRCATPRTYSLLSQFSTGAFRLEWSPETREGGSLRKLVLDNLRDIPHLESSTEFKLIPGDGIRAIRPGELPEWLERIPSGLPDLDSAVGGGYPSGSMVLISGGPGSGKTLLALKSSAILSSRGLRVLFVSFAEGSEDILRRVRSLGDEVTDFRAVGADPSIGSVARHIQELKGALTEHSPDVVVVDALELMVSLLDRWEEGLRYLRFLRGWVRDSKGLAVVSTGKNPLVELASPLFDVSLELEVLEVGDRLVRTLKVRKVSYGGGSARRIPLSSLDGSGPR